MTCVLAEILVASVDVLSVVPAILITGKSFFEY